MMDSKSMPLSFYQLAVTASELPLASKLSDSDKVLVRLAASEVMVRCQAISQAIETLEPILDPTHRRLMPQLLMPQL